MEGSCNVSISLELSSLFPTLLQLSTTGEGLPMGWNGNGHCGPSSWVGMEMVTVERSWVALEPDMSSLCFAEVVAVWDAVSVYILEQLNLDKVGWGAGTPLPCKAWAMGSNPFLRIMEEQQEHQTSWKNTKTSPCAHMC